MRKYKNKIKKTRKNMRNKKGGFFTSSKVSSLPECDPNKLSMLKTLEDMQTNYLQCCPKSMFGKNSSPYCKQLDLNFQTTKKAQNDSGEYVGFSPEEVYNIKQNDTFDKEYPSNKKSWYQFWGGKTRRRRKYSKKQIK